LEINNYIKPSDEPDSNYFFSNFTSVKTNIPTTIVNEIKTTIIANSPTTIIKQVETAIVKTIPTTILSIDNIISTTLLKYIETTIPTIPKEIETILPSTILKFIETTIPIIPSTIIKPIEINIPTTIINQIITTTPDIFPIISPITSYPINNNIRCPLKCSKCNEESLLFNLCILCNINEEYYPSIKKTKYILNVIIKIQSH
jgi:hypothetical protein